jgi:hypothetical protein
MENRSRVDIISQIIEIASAENAAGGIKRTKKLFIKHFLAIHRFEKISIYAFRKRTDS